MRGRVHHHQYEHLYGQREQILEMRWNQSKQTAVYHFERSLMKFLDYYYVCFER